MKTTLQPLQADAVASAVLNSTLGSIPTPALVAFYNQETGKAVKRFATRARCESAVAHLPAVISRLAESSQAVAPPAAHTAKRRDTFAADSALAIAKRREAEKAAKVAEPKAQAEPKPDAEPKAQAPTPKEILASEAAVAARAVADAAARHRSEAVATSWKDAATREARSSRHGCAVADVTYTSVRAAFVALGLPLAAHQRVRKDLKAAGSLKFGGLDFKLVTL